MLTCSMKKIFGFVFPAARFEPGMAGYVARPLPLCYAVPPIHVSVIKPGTQQIKESGQKIDSTDVLIERCFKVEPRFVKRSFLFDLIKS